jgi:hypothetical protein
MVWETIKAASSVNLAFSEASNDWKAKDTSSKQELT